MYPAPCTPPGWGNGLKEIRSSLPSVQTCEWHDPTYYAAAPASTTELARVLAYVIAVGVT